MKLTHLAFDMDGVIYTSESFIAAAYEDAISRAKLPLRQPSQAEIVEQIGKPIDEIFRNLFPDITSDISMMLHKETLESIVRMIREERGRIFEGVADAIHKLSRNYRLVVCSNGRRQYVETILDHYGLTKCFGPVLTLEDLSLKHKGALLQAYMEREKTAREQWAMIGDRTSDWNAAKFVGCTFIGCLWGHAHLEELLGADILLKRPEDLMTIL